MFQRGLRKLGDIPKTYQKVFITFFAPMPNKNTSNQTLQTDNN
jgi:hypothetical protein